MREYLKFYIDGQWVPSTGSGTIDVINASTEEVMGRIPDGSADDVGRAVARTAGGPVRHRRGGDRQSGDDTEESALLTAENAGHAHSFC